MRHRFLGTTVDFHPALRDAVLAGGYSCLVFGAALGSVMGFVAGAASGVMLGSVLHVLPAEPEPDDERLGRAVVRAISGAAAGGLTAAGVAYMANGALLDPALAPSTSTLVLALVLGAVAGAAWYIGWAIWETRPGAPRSVVVRAEATTRPSSPAADQLSLLMRERAGAGKVSSD